ncbi:DnaJ-domain-containing protein [Mycena filopes]|nr:DnaJ-domain-containing protein [Mycena filopes]
MSAPAPEAEVNPYELLELKLDCTDQEIRTAYRQTSRKNRNDPDAARKFHVLTQSYELLLDPLRRLALDAKLRVKAARNERFKSYDNKRKNMVTELEERERAPARGAGESTPQARRGGAAAAAVGRRGARGADTRSPRSLDTTIRLKFKLSAHPDLTTPSALAALLAPFGETDADSIVISSKPPKKSPDKPPKHTTALVPFKQIGNAFAAVCASGRADRGMGGIEAGWVGGKEPEILVWLKKMGKLSAQPPPPTTTTTPAPASTHLPQTAPGANAAPFSSFPATFPDLPSFSAEPKAAAPGVDYEALTLMRLRQAERERLEREILEQEAAE